MIRLVQRQLIIPRGDTGTFSVPVIATQGDSDASIFTIFDPLLHKKIFEKEMVASDGVLNLTFTHKDTVNLPIGQYVWDIKFYKNVVKMDGVFVDGDEVDSYYAAFKLPVCEIRQTGDALLTADDAPTSTLSPESMRILDVMKQEIEGIKDVVNARAAEVEEVGGQAAQSASDANEASVAASAAAAQAAVDAAAVAETEQTIRSLIPEIPDKLSDLTDDMQLAERYIKPANGIPDSDLEETYVKPTDYATTTTAGLVRFTSTSGFIYGTRGAVYLNSADLNTVKEGTIAYSAVTPYTAANATFYGLAKIAGADEKDSELPAGTYSATAKTAIKTMLGVQEGLEVVRLV